MSVLGDSTTLPRSAAVDNPDSQEHARNVLQAFHRALRALRLYPRESTVVNSALVALDQSVAELLQTTERCEIQCVGDYVFVSGTRLRIQLDTYAEISHVSGRFREAGVGGVLVTGRPDPAAWVALLSAFLTPTPGLLAADRRLQIVAQLEGAGVPDFFIAPAVDDLTDRDEGTAQERTRLTFLQSLMATRQLMTDVRMGRTPALRQAKRAVQAVIDQIMIDDNSLIGMTTLRDFDEYTFVHSVNVCILAVALGRRIGLSKLQLLDLGLAALMHDIGKTRVPIDVLNKPGKLTDDEFTVLKGHTWQGVLALFAMSGSTARAWRSMTVAYEHHLRLDLSGYPRTVHARDMSLFSRIVSIVDGFDAATSTRVYQPNPWSAADVIRGMHNNPRLGLDPLLVRVFTGMMGIYPIGTVVRLDSNEIALVVAASEEGKPPARPKIRRLFDARENPVDDATILDLCEKDATGQHLRTIIRTEEADRFGIRLRDYLT